jgi:hypothetical protein
MNDEGPRLNWSVVASPFVAPKLVGPPRPGILNLHARIWVAFGGRAACSRLRTGGCPQWTPSRVSQVPAGSFCARCLLPPRGVQSVPVVVASRTDAGFTRLGGLTTPILRNEAEPSSRDATARTFAVPSFSEQSRLHSLWVRLHDFRPTIMANAFQLIITSQACLALS